LARHEEAMHYASDEPCEGAVVCADEEEELGRVMGRLRAAALRHTLHNLKYFIKKPFFA